MRQQYANALNIEIAQFAVEMVRNFKQHMKDPAAPDIALDSFASVYLAKAMALPNKAANSNFRLSSGEAMQIMTKEDITRHYPFYNLEDIILGSHNRRDEGYFDGAGIFDWCGAPPVNGVVVYRHDQVVALDHARGRVTAVHLASGDQVVPGLVIRGWPTPARWRRWPGLITGGAARGLVLCLAQTPMTRHCH